MATFEHPILFQAEMVCAILDGRKTMTRRVIKPQPNIPVIGHPLAQYELLKDWLTRHKSPYGQPGDQLWVRETYHLAGALFYRADGEPGREDLDLYPNWKWQPSIFMSRAFSRITLEIVNVRVERLQEMPWRDVLLEGIDAFTVSKGVLSDNPPDSRWKFIEVWDKINAKRGFGWDVNPWVWVIEFKRILQPLEKG